MFFAKQGSSSVHIDDAKKGEVYYCPECNDELIIRKGKVRTPHFAHKYLHSCEGASETHLHALAKRIISEEGRIKIPALVHDGKTIPAKMIDFESIDLEVRLESIQVDLLGVIGKKCLGIEIMVTHGIEDLKLHRIKRMGLAVIEINLALTDRSIDKQTLRNELIFSTKNKRWVNNPKYPNFMDYIRLPQYKDYPSRNFPESTYPEPSLPDSVDSKSSNKSVEIVKKIATSSFYPIKERVFYNNDLMVFCYKKKILLEDPDRKGNSGMILEEFESNPVEIGPGLSTRDLLGLMVQEEMYQGEEEGFIVHKRNCSGCPYFHGEADSNILCSAKYEINELDDNLIL